VKEYYDKTIIVFLHEERVYGEIESLGLYASKVKFSKNGQDYEELIENDEFTIMDELLISHVEEE
jgi:hypothetical protein